MGGFSVNMKFVCVNVIAFQVPLTMTYCTMPANLIAGSVVGNKTGFG